MHITGSSYAWFIFNLNTKSRYSQKLYYSIYTWDTARVNPTPCSLLPAFFTCHPLFMLPTFLLTWRSSYLARGANIYPLLSLVCCQLLILCHFSPFATSPTLTHPIDQVTIFTWTTSTTSAVLSDTVLIY
jgi:hypothetical protein